MNPFRLLRQRRFSPLFWVQFSCAMNDNIFKSGLIVLMTFQTLQLSGLSSPALVNLAALLYIISFFLFSTFAGFLADKYEKSQLIQKLKLFEVCILVLAGLAFYQHSLPFLLFILFLLGLQAALFGPLKYSILPQHLSPEELLEGNALIEMGTFIAILIGSLLGSSLICLPSIGIPLTLGILLASSLTSYKISFYIPFAAPNDPALKWKLRSLFNIAENLKIAAHNKAILLTMFALSWFWLFGAFVLTQLPSYVHLVLQGNEQVFSLFLAIFSIGVGIGSLICGKFSRKVNLTWVGIGGIGMTVFTAGLFWLAPHDALAHPLFNIVDFLKQDRAVLTLLCLLSLSISAGFYTVPLFVVLQQASEPQSRARVIAANNILNALFMIVAAVLGMGLLKLNFSIPQMLLCIALLNLLVNVGFFMLRSRYSLSGAGSSF